MGAVQTSQLSTPEMIAYDLSIVNKRHVPYAQVVAALSAPIPFAECSVFLYGSARWGDYTILADGRPISDVDLLVIGSSLDDLRIAASHLNGVFRRFRRDDAPLFKLGLKMRTHSELTDLTLTVNEVSALTGGRRLNGPPVTFHCPRPLWFRRQARLVVPTRLHCNATQREFASSPNDPLNHYLAARTLLDIPTLLIRRADDLRGGYRERLTRFGERLASIPVKASEKTRLRSVMAAALATKLAPEKRNCGSIDEAEELLAGFAAKCGVEAADGNGMVFWNAHRPLDVRDWELRQTSL
jgi:hypothetical protein